LTVLAPHALLLADGRFPGGGHAHSGGLEAAVADGSIDPARLFPTLQAFVAGRLAATGAIDAWLAASSCSGGDEAELDAEADARCPSPALRVASRRLGRGLRRAAARSFPVVAGGPGQHHPVVVGVVARAAGLGPDDAAQLAVHHVLAGAVSAAVRLLPIDAADAMAVAIGLTALAAEVAAEGGAAARGPLCDGPAWSAPLVELRAEAHARWEVRLFAS
jgi:urease accessory protein